MNSIFRYPGGKSRKNIRARIIKHMPLSMGEYREPCVGGGGIFFSIPTGLRRWINDINPGLIAVYTALRDRPSDFIAKCRAIAPDRGSEPLVPAKDGKALYNGRMKALFDEFSTDEKMDQALRYFYINRTVWGGRVVYGDSSRMYFSNPRGWNITGAGRGPAGGGGDLEAAARIIEGARITCGDYSVLLEEPGEDVVIYLDPPYLVNTEMSRQSQLYEDSFSWEDHVTMSERVKRCSHRVVLSYDDDERIRALYPEKDGFHLFSDRWKYAGSSRETKVLGNELIITNYPSTLF